MTSSLTSPNALLSQIRHNELPLLEIVALVRHKVPLVRANALLALSSHLKGQDAFVSEITEAAKDPMNSVRLMGKRLADMAVACLLAIETPKSEEAALEVIRCWTRDDRYDVLSWAKRVDLMEPDDLASYEDNQKITRNRVYEHIQQAITKKQIDLRCGGSSAGHGGL